MVKADTFMQVMQANKTKWEQGNFVKTCHP